MAIIKDDSENSTMATDLFLTLFMVMLLAIGSTPAVKKADQDVTEAPDKQREIIYMYTDVNGALYFNRALDGAIPGASLASTLEEKIGRSKPDELIIAFLPDATAQQIHKVMQLVEDAIAQNNGDLPISWTVLEKSVVYD